MKPRLATGLGAIRARLFSLCAMAGLLALSGCSVNPATGEQSFTAFLSPDEERAAGREADPRIRRQFGGAHDDRRLQAYITRIGKALAAQGELPDLDFTFTVLNSSDVNAFALPGGYIYVTRGLLALADTEAQLAGVLAHEIGHVTARHAAQRYSHGKVTNFGKALAQFAESSVLGALFNVGSAVYLSGYSREQEFEADTLGVRYLLRAGYDPRGVAGFLGKLREHAILRGEISGSAQDPDQFQLLATHPRTIDRVEQTLAAARVSSGMVGRTGREAYLRQIEGLIYGADPRHGVIRGRTFMHLGRGYRFSIPPDFSMRKTGGGVRIVGPLGIQVAMDEAPIVSSMSLENYLTRIWAPSLKLGGVERITINGLSGATGFQSLMTRRGRATLRLIAVRLRPRTVVRFQIIAPAKPPSSLDIALRRMTYSLERIPAARAPDIRPARITLHTVRQGETIDSLAALMPEGRFRARRFQILNGISNPGEIAPGMVVKLVTQ